MSASVYDSALYAGLFGAPDMARLVSDTAELRAMMIVEGALAKVQGDLGLIPQTAGNAIHRAALELQIDPGGLARETGRSAVPVPALVAAFRTEMQAPDHAAWLHYGATSQDIVDTALALRLRQALALAEAGLHRVLGGLARLAGMHAETPMAGRTYGQAATVTGFGAMAASWGTPLLAARDEMPALRARVLRVSLSGAAGTLSAMGEAGPDVRAGLAAALGLVDPGRSWHAERDGIAALSAWAGRVTGATGRMGEDLLLLTQSGIEEVALPGTGGSSTMPQKRNPVMPSLLVALARTGTALDAALQGAQLHRQQRDGAAWMTEWMVLPQVLMGLARSLAVAGDLAEGIAPRPDAMRAAIAAGGGLIHAEALSFALARQMPRPEAQDAVRALCAEVAGGAGSLAELAGARFPQLDIGALFRPEAQLGRAPAEARAFAARVRALPEPEAFPGA
ncbi:lyase family protein [Wenxinia saemankumensis]|uniref:3-carboxy-cis,cis-muconate cycloisomerase n=1 Tax=Wenxinia saemankumensis TaxID=1447782 RepID=A0A1M6C472_9RHOB|nr:lyase family protein [Wenxinia saemankumensis]SHI55508.1 3-carboxy-cis,cis-muconate cycloisomerase [Wenxinia saemankumensis]